MSIKRICRTCSKPLHGKSAQSAQCGACNRARMRAAQVGHVYVRTHVHTWPDGAKTMEYGVRCEESCGAVGGAA